jgi:hypothetical protein
VVSALKDNLCNMVATFPSNKMSVSGCRDDERCERSLRALYANKSGAANDFTFTNDA